MTFLFLGVAIGVLVMGLLRAWTRYEADSVAAFREEAIEMRQVIHTLTKRVEVLEAIATAETSDGGLDTSLLSDEPLSGSEPESQRRESIPVRQAP